MTSKNIREVWEGEFWNPWNPPSLATPPVHGVKLKRSLINPLDGQVDIEKKKDTCMEYLQKNLTSSTCLRAVPEDAKKWHKKLYQIIESNNKHNGISLSQY